MEDRNTDQQPAEAGAEAHLIQSALWQPDAAKALLTALRDPDTSNFKRETLIHELAELTDQQLLSFMRTAHQHCANMATHGHRAEDQLIRTLTTHPRNFSSRFPMLPLLIAGALCAFILGAAASEGAYGAWGQTHVWMIPVAAFAIIAMIPKLFSFAYTSFHQIQYDAEGLSLADVVRTAGEVRARLNALLKVEPVDFKGQRPPVAAGWLSEDCSKGDRASFTY